MPKGNHRRARGAPAIALSQRWPLDSGMIPSTKPFALRPARANDRDAIAAIWHSGASLPHVGPAALPPLNELRQRVDQEFAEGWQVTVATQDDVIVGFLALLPEAGILDQLFVRTDAFGLGIGRALFAEAIAAMPKGFTLFTRPGNAQARRLYEAAAMTMLREEIHPRFGDTIMFYGWQPE